MGTDTSSREPWTNSISLLLCQFHLTPRVLRCSGCSFSPSQLFMVRLVETWKYLSNNSSQQEHPQNVDLSPPLFCEMLDEFKSAFTEVAYIFWGHFFSSFSAEKGGCIIVILTVILGISSPWVIYSRKSWLFFAPTHSWRLRPQVDLKKIIFSNENNTKVGNQHIPIN